MKADPAFLDSTSDTVSEERGVVSRLRGWGYLLAQRASSSLTRRIVVLNLAGLVALLVGFLYLNQFRQGLIEAQGEPTETIHSKRDSAENRVSTAARPASFCGSG